MGEARRRARLSVPKTEAHHRAVSHIDAKIRQLEARGLLEVEILPAMAVIVQVPFGAVRVSVLLFQWRKGAEPPHILIEHGDKVAKYWLNPVELAESVGFRSHELTRVRALVIEHRVPAHRSLESCLRNS